MLFDRAATTTLRPHPNPPIPPTAEPTTDTSRGDYDAVHDAMRLVGDQTAATNEFTFKVITLVSRSLPCFQGYYPYFKVTTLLSRLLPLFQGYYLDFKVITLISRLFPTANLISMS